MSKKQKQSENAGRAENISKASRRDQGVTEAHNADHSSDLIHMSRADVMEKGSHWVSLIPAILFGAIVVLIVRGAIVTHDMQQFYWTNQSDEIADFFSYDKMILIIIASVLALFVLLCRLLTVSLVIRRNAVYIPMAIYAVMVILSYAFSRHKEFSLLGYVDRYEGTIVILSYLIMLFFVINMVRSESNVKLILICMTVSVSILSLIGISQATGHDFFQSYIGRHLIVPSSWGDVVDSLKFAFTENQIYQTVYNINYVSFYLALIIPVCALILLYSVNNFKTSRKFAGVAIFSCVLYCGLIYNLAGSRSMGGIVGLAVAFVTALIVLNVKLIKWWKATAVLAALTLVMGAATSGMWLGEINSSMDMTGGSSSDTNGIDQTVEADETDAGTEECHIDYFKTDGSTLQASFAGNELNISAHTDTSTGQLEQITLSDEDGNSIEAGRFDSSSGSVGISVNDDRFYKYVRMYLTQDDQQNIYLTLVTAGERQWPFIVSSEGLYYVNGYGNYVKLTDVPSIGFENDQDFGSGRGYIWSRGLAMLKYRLIIGDGADTFCLNFPHNDYVGKYQAGFDPDIIVDKPHDMYINICQGTGLISLLAFLGMIIVYFVQTVKRLRHFRYDNWTEYLATGILIGVVGFLIGALFNDSTVSTMPMFYTLMGLGFAINHILKEADN